MSSKERKLKQLIREEVLNELGGYVDLQPLGIGGMSRTSGNNKKFNFNPDEFSKLHEKKGSVVLSEDDQSSVLVERTGANYNLVIRNGSQENTFTLDPMNVEKLRQLINR